MLKLIGKGTKEDIIKALDIDGIKKIEVEVIEKGWIGLDLATPPKMEGELLKEETTLTVEEEDGHGEEREEAPVSSLEKLRCVFDNDMKMLREVCLKENDCSSCKIRGKCDIIEDRATCIPCSMNEKDVEEQIDYQLNNLTKIDVMKYFDIPKQLIEEMMGKCQQEQAKVYLDYMFGGINDAVGEMIEKNQVRGLTRKMVKYCKETISSTKWKCEKCPGFYLCDLCDEIDSLLYKSPENFDENDIELVVENIPRGRIEDSFMDIE